MPHAVFLRAANVGGRNVFRPAQLATALRHLGFVNVGAAGTFVVRERASAAAIRDEILAKLPFELDLAVVPGRTLQALVRTEPFHGVTFSKDLRGWAAILCRRPGKPPRLPLEAPTGKPWTVRLDRIEGPFALGLHRRRAGAFLFPNQVVEKALGTPATTRWWETILQVARLLEG